MVLKGINNQSVEIKISEYQFPDAEKNSIDSEWLNIFIDVKSHLGSWQTVDPSLTVSEFEELIYWFKDLSLNRDVKYKELNFTEPNLEFNLVKEENRKKHIRIIFNAESKPRSAKEGQEYYIDFQFSNDELSSIAKGLEAELKKLA